MDATFGTCLINARLQILHTFKQAKHVGMMIQELLAVHMAYIQQEEVEVEVEVVPEKNLL